jgi:hypothetical protein
MRHRACQYRASEAAAAGVGVNVDDVLADALIAAPLRVGAGSVLADHLVLVDRDNERLAVPTQLLMSSIVSALVSRVAMRSAIPAF